MVETEENQENEQQSLNPCNRQFLANQWRVTVTYAHLNLTYYFILFAVVMLWTQLSPYQSSLGLSTRQTGIISIVGSIVFIIFPSLAGLIADKLGDYTKFLTTACALNLVVPICFAYLPSFIEETFSNQTDLNVSEVDSILSNFTDNSSNLIRSGIGQFISENIFEVYIVLHACFMALNSITVTLFESAAITLVAVKDEYCYVKSFGVLASIMAGPFGGWLVTSSTNTGPGKFKDLFRVSVVFQFIAMISLSRINLKERPPCPQVGNSLRILYSRKDLLGYFVCAVFAGASMGIIETFLYRYILEELNGSHLLLGYTITVGGISDFIFNRFLPCLMILAGKVNLMAFGFVLTGVRFLGIYSIENPNMVLATEALDVFSNNMIMNIVMTYAAEEVEDKYVASFRGLLGTAFMGFGKLLGSFGGTFLNEVTDFNKLWMFSSIPPFLIATVLVAVAIISYFKNLNVVLEESGDKSPTRNVELSGISANSNESENKASSSCDETEHKVRSRY